MWLSLMGRATTRAEAHRAFGTRRVGWIPPDEAAIVDVLRRMLGSQPVRQASRRYGCAASFVAACRRRLQTSDALLGVATCRLRIERIAARHAFVVTGHEFGSLQVLDSLGLAPISSRPANASILASRARHRFVPVAGARWDIDLHHPIALIGSS
jgi:hypothetical protein